MAQPVNPGGTIGPNPNSLRPPTFKIVMAADQQTLFAQFTYGQSINFLSYVPTIRIWYIDGTLTSGQQISQPGGIPSGYSQLLASFPVSRGKPVFEIPFPIASYPLLFSHGGWLWVDSIGTGDEDWFPSTGPVPIPTRSVTATPAFNVDAAAVAISPVTIDGTAYKKILFSWMNPNGNTPPYFGIDTLYYVLIIMYNYRNLGLYEELMFFPTVQANGSAGTASNISRGGNYLVGPIYLIPDFDGAHNVRFYFVSENRSHMKASTWLALVGPGNTATATGGV